MIDADRASDESNELAAPRHYASLIFICVRKRLGTPPRLSHDSEYTRKSAK